MSEKLAIQGGAPVRSKPFPNWPVFDERELDALRRVLYSGQWGCTSGSEVHEFEEQFAAFCGAQYGLCMTSGTSALETALWAVGVEPGDEVIVPACTYMATAVAVLAAGAIPVVADIDESITIDPKDVEARIGPRTRAVIPVHMWGLSCDMNAIMDIAERHDLLVVEDACQAVGGAYEGRMLGAIGHAGAFSFNYFKNMTAGEGGLVVCDDKDLGEWVYGVLGHAGKQIDAIRSKEGRKMDGWNYRMTEFQAAILLVQLARAEEQKRRRMENADYLRARLAEIDGIGEVPHSPEQNYYSFMFKYDARYFKGLPKKKFKEALAAEGIPTFCSPGDQYPAYRSPHFHSPVEWDARKAAERRARGVPYVLLWIL